MELKHLPLSSWGPLEAPKPCWTLRNVRGPFLLRVGSRGWDEPPGARGQPGSPRVRQDGRTMHLRVLTMEHLNMEQNLSFCLSVYSCLFLRKRSLHTLSHSSKEG